MAEIIQRDGRWAFDGGTVRITPGRHRSVSPLRRAYGEVRVPLEAVAGIAVEPVRRRRGRLGQFGHLGQLGRSRPGLRLRLREGADPLLQATGGRLPAGADPYRLALDADRFGVAEYLAEEIRGALLCDQVPEEPAGAYLVPGPPVPVAVRCSDGTVSFDGTRVRVDWADTADRAKRVGGPMVIGLDDLVGVEWLPRSGLGDGFLRFVTGEAVRPEPPAPQDPYALDLWGGARRDLLTALVAAAVTARLPHPSAGGTADTGRGAGTRCGGRVDALPRPRFAGTALPPAGHHDVLLRRLRELGELHRGGVLTDGEFATTKAAVLRGFGAATAPTTTAPAHLG